MITVEKNISIKEFTTFRLECIVSHFVTISTSEDLAEALDYADAHNLSVYILGGGSNMLFSKPKLDGLVIKITITGYTITKETDTTVSVEVGAGESWDLFVEQMVGRGYAGIEALSFIPGTVGATPVQNVGAYGVEVGDVIESVTVYNTQISTLETLSSDACQFSYRDSIFKKDVGKKYIIVAVVYILKKQLENIIPQYPGVMQYFTETQKTAPLQKIRDTIITIRTQKLPHPDVISSCGSFFKNPFITKIQAEHIREKYPNAIIHETDTGMYKIGAGWLIDTVGLKGRDFGTISVYPHNALVLVNTHNTATFADLQTTVEYIQKAVYNLFEITLEMEPIVI